MSNREAPRWSENRNALDMMRVLRGPWCALPTRWAAGYPLRHLFRPIVAEILRGIVGGDDDLNSRLVCDFADRLDERHLVRKTSIGRLWRNWKNRQSRSDMMSARFHHKSMSVARVSDYANGVERDPLWSCYFWTGYVVGERLGADLIRDVFPAVRPVPGETITMPCILDTTPPTKIHPEWRTSTVTSLARELFTNRDWGNLPVLADAIQDAGCEREDILAHLRSSLPHCRGCWVLQYILEPDYKI